ncbi:membrane-spanning 4-domains subfamily A member 4D-like isoform X2 [Neolamprologus brichardi]|nr:membrane-spanning 4-domains subfamily A member 4D-like isoform X2 [Neolamprologus brichardi]
MEGTQELKTTTREEGTTERNGDQGTSSNVPMSSKPLHRFVRKEPRSLGIVILMFGCAELLMGFQFSGEEFKISAQLYIPFWQGALFLTCGILSVYTELHPSKKMVTVCLALYVVSILGIVISFIHRIIQLIHYPYFFFLRFHLNDASVMLLQSIKAILLTSTICVLVILIFLTTVASFALKSTRTQVIVQQIPPPRTETPSD